MHQLARFAPEVNRTATLRLPRFLSGTRPKSGDIPVLHYAEVAQEELAADLEYLASGGYRTIGLDEFMHTRERSSRERRVLLTFDDARKNFWEVVMPLLQTHEARAALFVPSYWVAPCTSADDPFMSWEQLRMCAQSGRVDVQSHAHRHTKVFTSNRLLNFTSPQSVAHSQFHTWPMRVIGNQEELGWPAFGTPLYEAAPLLSAPHRYLENSDLTEACRAFVLEQGGEEFFQDPEWAARLRDFHDRQGRPGYLMRTPDFLKFLAAEFEFSREQFRLHLGYAPRYFAYPWRVGSDVSLRFAKHAGFSAIFGADTDGPTEHTRHAPLPIYSRTKRDWLPHLPRAERTHSLGSLSLGSLIKLEGGLDANARLALGKLQQAGESVAAKLRPVAHNLQPFARHAGHEIRSATRDRLKQLASLPTARKLLARGRERLTPRAKVTPVEPG